MWSSVTLSMRLSYAFLVCLGTGGTSFSRVCWSFCSSYQNHSGGCCIPTCLSFKVSQGTFTYSHVNRHTLHHFWFHFPHLLPAQPFCNPPKIRLWPIGLATTVWEQLPYGCSKRSGVSCAASWSCCISDCLLWQISCPVNSTLSWQKLAIFFPLPSFYRHFGLVHKSCGRWACAGLI